MVEFGVAGGDGLVALQAEAEAVEREMGVAIKVYGFDAGSSGMPAGTGDYRDHPDRWQPGDYPMNPEQLRTRLTERTTLILGNVRDTVQTFGSYAPPPIGFVSFDLDFYSSTRDALRIFDMAEMLWHVPVYLDDIEFFHNHRYAGVFLAIDEFNAGQDRIKIDQWYGVKNDRPFPERAFLDKMYVAHDLKANAVIKRDARAALPLTEA